MWKKEAVVKKNDGTFIIAHCSKYGKEPYHVCRKEIDPHNLYDLAEVAAFWESLPADDPRKQVYTDPEPEPDTRTPMEQRADAYAAEADPLFQQAQFYQAEADGLKAAGDYENAALFEARATDFKKRYAAAKAAIRLRLPDRDDA